MSMEDDVNLLGNLKPGDTNDVNSQPNIQDPNPVDGALNATNVDLIDQIVVDFSEVDKQNDALKETEGSLQSIGQNNRIDQMRFISLESTLGPLKDRHGCSIQVTAGLSGLNVSKVLESAAAALDVKRIEICKTIAGMAGVAGKLRNSIEEGKAQFDQATVEFVRNQSVLADIFGTVFIPHAMQQVDGDLTLSMAGSINYASLDIDEGYPEEKALKEVTRKIRTGTSHRAAMLSLADDMQNLIVAGRAFLIEDLDSHNNGAAYYDTDMPELRKIIDSIGTVVHTNRANVTHQFAVKAAAELSAVIQAAEEASAQGDVSVVTNQRLFLRARMCIQILSEANTQMKALMDLYTMGNNLINYMLARRKEGLTPATEGQRHKRKTSFSDHM